jgi:glycine/D-amino acid oxidase-like deaminating enzyme
MTRYSSPYWLSRVPQSQRPSWPRFRDAMACDVVIVGGGLTGCAAAYLFAASGIRTCLVEADRIGQGASAADTGLIRPHPAACFADLERACGRRAARHMWELSRHAALDLAALVRRLRIRCDLEPRELFSIARHDEDEALLKREHKAVSGAGLDAVWFSAARLSRELGVEARGGLRMTGGAHLDPYCACVGFARAAGARGARVYEQSPVVRVRAGRAGVEVETRGGPMAARTVVIATGGPTALFKPLQRHFRQAHTYRALTPSLEAARRRHAGRHEAVLAGAHEPSRVLVRTRDDRLLFSGADQRQVPDRRRPKAVIQRTGQLMYELSLLYPEISGVQPEYGWDAAIAETADGVMYAGPHRNYPHHLFALGTGHNGPAAAFLAARILVRHYAGSPGGGDEVFGFNRA